MTANAGGALYTRDLLALAVSLADTPLDPSLPLTGEARSATCGSVITIGLATTPDGAIERLGARASACAVGQAAAAIFVKGAVGRSAEELAQARPALMAWLSGTGARPDWPGVAALEPALGYPARHGAIPLAWTAALAALSKAGVQS